MDNVGSDNSAASAEAFANVTMLRMASNPGFTAGNNVAFTQSDTEFVAILNPYAFPEPDWLQSLPATTSAQPEVSAYGSRQLCEGTPGVFDGIGDSYLGRVRRKRYQLQDV
jgi:GT2 family glycosyltransferase